MNWRPSSSGGAIAEVLEDATAYSNRRAVFDFSIDNVWENPSENDAQITWARDFFAEIYPRFVDRMRL